jgi:hypothetical protein
LEIPARRKIFRPSLSDVSLSMTLYLTKMQLSCNDNHLKKFQVMSLQ